MIIERDALGNIKEILTNAEETKRILKYIHNRDLQKNEN